MTQTQMQELIGMKWEKVTLTPSESEKLFTEKHCLAFPNYIIIISKFKNTGDWLLEVSGIKPFNNGLIIKNMKDLIGKDAQKAILAYIVDELNNEMLKINEKLNMLNYIHTSIFNFKLVNLNLNIE